MFLITTVTPDHTDIFRQSLHHKQLYWPNVYRNKAGLCFSLLYLSRNTIQLDVGINYGVSMGWITTYYGNVTVLYGNAVIFTI